MKSLLFLFLSFSIILPAQKPYVSIAKVTGATVYFNAAEITQTTNLQLPEGTSEVIVRNIANTVNENTLQIGVPTNVTILSAQFANDQNDQNGLFSTSPNVKKLTDSIELVQKEISKIQTAKNTEVKVLDLLDANRVVAGQQTGLSVAELMKMVDYYKTKRTEVDLAISNLNEKAKDWNDKLAKLNNRLQDLRSQNEQSPVGKLTLRVMCQSAGEVPFVIRYLSPNASWTPNYDLKAASISQPIELTYKAQVVQFTGIDWKQVKLTLSSGTPNQNNQAPLLSSWQLRFGAVYSYRGNQFKTNSIQMAPVAADSKIAQMEASSTIDDYTTVNDNQLNISFDIDIPYDILSNGSPYSVALKQLQIPAKYKYYSVPKMETEAYLLAEIEDYSKYNLLKGEANIIFENMYTGKTIIDPNQVTESMNISMGHDKKISIKREKLVDKSGTKFLSSYKVQTFTYEIQVRNNKKERANMILKDQYPLSTDKEIEVELLDSDGAAINNETGILTWTLDLAPNEIKKLRISYSVKYPKDKVIGNL